MFGFRKLLVALLLLFLLFFAAVSVSAKEAPEQELGTFEPTPSATLARDQAIDSAPLSLMMHYYYASGFDAAGFLSELLESGGNNAFTTYVSWNGESGVYIVSIDDFRLGSKPNPVFNTMVEKMAEHGKVGVVGVVTFGSKPNADAVELLKNLQKSGWEIASHTDNHPNLCQIKASKALEELRVSADKIDSAGLVRPVTIILPYGVGSECASRLFSLAKEAGYENIVGIAGSFHEVADGPRYFGREGPVKDLQTTLRYMEVRFGGR